MTTQDAAQAAVDSLIKGSRRQLKKEPGVWTWKWAHLRVWGTGKVGKTDMLLRARTTEIRAKDRVENFQVVEKGKIILPSKPLPIAYANFDRSVHTVLDNLPDDVDIIEEPFYEDEEGFPLIPLAMSERDFTELYQKFVKFQAEAWESGRQLFVTDGGSIIWEHQRHWKVPSTEDKDKVPPKAYAEANSSMRERVMQRLYGLQMHTAITCETSEVWASASGPLKDDAGNTVMKADGWNKTNHYIDLDVKMRWKDQRNTTGELEKVRVAVPTETALKASILGREYPSPTFEQLYRANYGNPLILRSDLDEFRRILEETGGNVTY